VEILVTSSVIPYLPPRLGPGLPTSKYGADT